MKRQRLIWVGLTKTQLKEVAALLWSKGGKKASIYALKFMDAVKAFEK